MDDHSGYNRLERVRRAFIARNGESALIDMTNSRFDRAGATVPESLYREIYDEWRREPTYEPSGRGSVETRSAVAAALYYREDTISPEDIVLTAGSSVSYLLLFLRLSERGTPPGSSAAGGPATTVLLPTPGYPLFEAIAADAGVSVAWYRCRPDRGFLPDVDEIRRGVSAGAAAVVIITPNNPSGVVVPPETRYEIDAICRASGAILIVDEVFDTFRRTYTTPPGSRGNDAPGTPTPETPLTVRINGLSKMCAAPEIKLGWLAITGGNAEERAVLADDIDTRHDTYLTVSGYAEAAGRVLLGTPRGEELRDRVAATVMAQHVVFDSTILEIPGIETTYRDGDLGGIHRIVRIDPVVAAKRFGTIDDEEIACRILEETGVLVHPGYLYGIDEGGFGGAVAGAPWFVTTVLHEEATVLRAGDRLRKLLA